MAHKITLSLLLLSVLKVVVPQYNCNVNEYLTETVNPCNTCDNRGWCPENYGVACDCIPGYFRNSQGVCVPPEACDGPYGTPYGKDVPPPETCKDPNEVYTECGSGCAPTCEGNSNRACPAVCVPGCFCKRGYVKNSQGMCVRPDQCNRGYTKETYNCGANEEFQSCGTSCPATCDNPRPNSGACIQRCVTGCFCTTGYVRKDGKCVRESECKAPSVGPRSYHGPSPYGPRPYRPPPRPITNPPVVLPPPKPPTYPAPAPPVYQPPIRPIRPPPPPPAYPPAYPPAPPTDTKGCPNRNLCNRNCKSEGFAVGFCVGEGFLKCNCMG